jgi:hypothetical protein
MAPNEPLAQNLPICEMRCRTQHLALTPFRSVIPVGALWGVVGRLSGGVARHRTMRTCLGSATG